jgi:gliding-associated putative ABC transporter substrate-binding component GldG
MEIRQKFEWKKSLSIPILVITASLVLLNLISRNWFERLDLTDNKMYTLSSSSRSVVKKIDDLMTMKVFFSGNLPNEFGNNRRYLQDILEEYAAYSKGKIRFEFNTPEKNEDVQQEAQRLGIQPVQLQVIENDKMEVKRVHMGLAILYQDEKEVIPVIQSTTGLEYEITTKIKRLVETNKPVVAIAKTENQEGIENSTITDKLRQRYTVRTVDLTSAVSKEIKLLLINGVEDSLSLDERDNLEKYIDRGGNLFLAQSHVSSDLTTQQANVINSDIFDLIETYGVRLEENLVLDRTCGRVNVQQNMGFIRMAVPMEYPLLPIIRSFNRDEVVVSGLEQVQLFFASEVSNLDSLSNDFDVNVLPLMYTSNKSGQMTGFFNLNPDPKNNPALKSLDQPKKLVAVRSERMNKESSLLSQLILVSDSRFLIDGAGGSSPENHILVMNAVDYLLGDKELISLRSREITIRPLDPELEDGTKRFLKWMNILLPSLLVVGFGFFRISRLKSRSRILEEVYD